jgi:polysaccharide biosynthesis/export protein
MYRRFLQLAMLMAIAVLIAACGGVKQAKKDMLILKQGTLDTLPNLTVPVKEAIIQKDDNLSIVVYSDNAEATAIFNQQAIASSANSSVSNTASAASSSNASSAIIAPKQTGGYLVDKAGNIRFHKLGLIKAEGLTRMELMDTMVSKLKLYLTNPYVDIRFLNSRVTIIGEVLRPGVFNMPDEKITVLELLGMAGDLTIYGKRENILVIREQNGRREFGRLDLRRADIFQSPYFYLQNNDKVVIEPNSKKPTATEQENLKKLTMVTAFATLVSTLSILITLF